MFWLIAYLIFSTLSAGSKRVTFNFKCSRKQSDKNIVHLLCGYTFLHLWSLYSMFWSYEEFTYVRNKIRIIAGNRTRERELNGESEKKKLATNTHNFNTPEISNHCLGISSKKPKWMGSISIVLLHKCSELRIQHIFWMLSVYHGAHYL